MAYKRAKRTNLIRFWDRYKKIRNNVANELKCARKDYFAQLHPSNPKAFRKTVKVLTKDESRVPVIKDECGVMRTDDSTKASILNDFFSKCFNKSVPPLITSEQPTFLNASSDYCPPDLFCSEKVLALRLSLDTTKTNGPHGLPVLLPRASLSCSTDLSNQEHCQVNGNSQQ